MMLSYIYTFLANLAIENFQIEEQTYTDDAVASDRRRKELDVSKL